jgi:hypothetical protein
MMKNPLIWTYALGTLIGILLLWGALSLVYRSVHSHLGFTAASRSGHS